MLAYKFHFFFERWLQVLLIEWNAVHNGLSFCMISEGTRNEGEEHVSTIFKVKLVVFIVESKNEESFTFIHAFH